VLFRAGGGIQLTELALSEHGTITGLLAFQFAGDGKQSASSLTGPFVAKICRFDPHQAKQE
jgi:hypothetical protein